MTFSLYNRFRQLEKVRVDKDALEGYLGAASTDGVLRTGAPLSYTDGGNYITLDITQSDTDTDGYLSSTDWDTFNDKATASHAMSTHSDEDTYNISTSGSITSSGTGGLTTGSVANTGKVVIFDGSDHSITLTSPSIAASYTLTLPINDGGANEFLQTNGSGILAWAASGGLANVVEDTTPQLGGDLDLNSNNIDFPSVANVSDCKDEDNMASDSATMLATQQSIKKYVDDQVAGVAGHAILDGTVHTDSVADAVTRGSIIYGNATPKWDELVVGAADTFLGSDGTDVSYRTAAQVLASLSAEAGAAFSWNSQDLSAIGTVACGEVTVADGSSINLQEAVTFTGATTENLIEMPDNLAVALDITEAGNSYMLFVTTNGSETITFGKTFGAVTGSTIGNLTLVDGSITDSGGSITFNDENISTTGTLGAGNCTLGTIGCNAITVADGQAINLQEDITFTGATTVNQIKFPDNLAVALDMMEGANSYLKFISTNGSEAVTISKALNVSGTTTIAAALTGLIRADSGVLSVDTDVTDLVSAASTTAQGKVELTIASEINTGTSATLAVTPDSLAGSYAGTKTIVLKAVDDATAPTVTDTAGHVTVPIELNGMDLVSVGANVYTASGGSGPVALHIYNLTQTADMLSTGLTIDDTETDSSTAGTPAVIDTNNDDVATADVLQIHVTDIGDASTRGLEVRMGFRLP